MDDFLCTMTCEEFYLDNDDHLTDDEKQAILNEESEKSENDA